MEPFKLIHDVDLSKGVKSIPLGTFVFEGDNNSLIVGSRVFNGGEPEVISGSVIGKVIRPDGGTVDYAGEKTDNVATITLTEAAFAYPGQLTITIKVASEDDKITIGRYTVDAKRTDTGTNIDPGGVVPGVDDVVALIGEMEDAIDEATAATEAAVEAVENIESVIDGLPENLDSDAEDVDLDISDQSGNVLVRFAGGHVQTKNFDSSGLSALFAGKQDSLTFDNVPTSGSNNPVKSGGVYSSLAGKVDVQQSTADAGKAMVVGSDGTLTPEDITINVDATLSQQGEAADAKATGDAIAELGEDVETLETAFTKTPAIQDNTATGTDLDVCDSQGNVILRLKGGHVQTKNFDSSSLSSSLAAKVSIQQSSSDAGKAMIVGNDGTLAPAEIPAQVEIDDTLSVSGDAADAKVVGDAIGDIEEDMETLETAFTKTPAIQDNTATGTDLDVCDSQGNVILRLKGGHIQTKNFNSENFNSEKSVIKNNESALDDALSMGANKASFTRANSPDSFMLLHFSDIHGDGDNLKNISHVMDYLEDVLDDTLCTGDIVDQFWSDSFSFWSANSDGKILTCIGNHDVKISGSTGYIQSQPTEVDIYNRYMAPFISNWGTVEHSDTNLYYYKDYPTKKIRLIVLNLLYPSAEKVTEQNTWLASALSGAKTAGYGVVIGEHYYPVSGTKIDCTFSALVNFPTSMSNAGNYMYNGDALTTYQATVQSFIDGGGNFACWLCGHKHADFIAYHPTYPKQVFIGVGGALFIENNYEYGSTSDMRRIAGTKSQDCMNVVAVDPTEKIIKVLRIGCDRDIYQRRRGALTLDYSTSPATVIHND